jgi:hypothetical protein
MSTNALVRTAWQENVFSNLNGGFNSYPRLIEPISQDEIRLGYDYNTKKIYFWSYVVSNVIAFSTIGGGVNNRDVKFKVEITHVRERATSNNPKDDTSMNLVIDGFETVAGYVRTNLLTHWDSTVDYYTPPEELEIAADTWDGKPVWRGKQIYTAIKKTAS